jgi:hypothetical protein
MEELNLQIGTSEAGKLEAGELEVGSWKLEKRRLKQWWYQRVAGPRVRGWPADSTTVRFSIGGAGGSVC